MRAARHRVHGRQHRHHAQVQGRALLRGGAAAVGLVPRHLRRPARLPGPPPRGHEPAARPVAVGSRLHGGRLRPVRPAAGGAGPQRGGRRQGGGNALPRHRAGLRHPSAGLRRGAGLDERDGGTAGAGLRAGHGHGEPAAQGRGASALGSSSHYLSRGGGRRRPAAYTSNQSAETCCVWISSVRQR